MLDAVPLKAMIIDMAVLQAKPLVKVEPRSEGQCFH